MIIDSHTHLNHYDPDCSRCLEEVYDDLRQAMEENGVDYACVLSSYKVTQNRPHVRDIVAQTRDDPRIIPIAGLSMTGYRLDELTELRDYLQDGLVRGLKLYPGYEHLYPYDPRCDAIYDLALEFDVPVTIHTGDTFTDRGKLRFSHPLNVDDVAVDHPGLKLIIAHLGNPWIRDCMEVVFKNRDVYTDVSGLVLGAFKPRFKQVMLDEIRHGIAYMGGPGYLLYGTDWPICAMDSYLRFMDDLHLDPETRERIMWRNAAELFKIDVDEPQMEPQMNADRRG